MPDATISASEPGVQVARIHHPMRDSAGLFC